MIRESLKSDFVISILYIQEIHKFSSVLANTFCESHKTYHMYKESAQI